MKAHRLRSYGQHRPPGGGPGARTGARGDRLYTRSSRADRPGVRVAEGDVLDRAAVATAIAGHDAVLVSLGGGRRGGVRGPGTKVIVDAMRVAGVRRLICQSTLGAGDSRANLTFFWKYVMFGALLRGAYADHQQQERHVEDSDLDWTIVRPGAFTDGERTGRYRHGFAGDDRTVRLKISRADVADFMLRLLREDLSARHTGVVVLILRDEGRHMNEVAVDVLAGLLDGPRPGGRFSCGRSWTRRGRSGSRTKCR